MHLYDFTMWYDVTKILPSEKTEYYEIRASLFFKKKGKEGILLISILSYYKGVLSYYLV